MKNFEDSIIEEDTNRAHVIGKGIIIQVPENVNVGFNFGYMLFIPEGISNYTTLIVEGPNVTTSTSDMNLAKKLVIDSVKSFENIIYSCNKESKFPILTPLFPRIYDGKETIYTHMLSSNSLNCSDELLKRVDIQLIHMVEDAKKRLSTNNIFIDDKIIINGFSASSKFANRFTLLHPEMVKLCIAGGVSGCLTLPLREINGEKLMYPVGIGDLEEITDDKIGKFLNIKQFYYQGLKDENDPFISTENDNYIPRFKGIITEQELMQLYKFLGRDMTKERWNNTQKIYKMMRVNAIFESYSNEGHRPHAAMFRIMELLNSNINKNSKTKIK